MTRTTITVRRAEPDDFEAVRDLLREGDRFHRSIGAFGARAQSDEYDRESFTATLDSDTSVILLAFRLKQVAGFLRLSKVASPGGRFHAARNYAEVQEIVVAEDARRANVGSELIRVAREWTLQHGLASLELNCFAENRAARDFYIRLGFVEQRIRFRLDLGEQTERRPMMDAITAQPEGTAS